MRHDYEHCSLLTVTSLESDGLRLSSLAVAAYGSDSELWMWRLIVKGLKKRVSVYE